MKSSHERDPEQTKEKGDPSEETTLAIEDHGKTGAHQQSA